MKIIIDTNIWISYFIRKSFNKLQEVLINKKYEIVFSNHLINEIVSVLKRNKFKDTIKEDQIIDIYNLLLHCGTFYKVNNNKKNLIRDSKDNFVLNLALISNADFIITGDNDLLILKKHKKTKIIKWKYFIDNIYND